MQYDEVNDEMELEKTEKVIFEEDENEEEQTEERKGLIAEEKDELILPPGQIKDYKEEL